jgi:hypothetical protein
MKKILFPVVSLLFILQANAQKMTVKDNDGNILMEVNDEGTTGSISLPAGETPSATSNKLYNVSGSLFWNGTALGMSGSAGGWTDGGANVYTTTSTDMVGIGTSTPEFKLSLDDDGGILSKGTLQSGITLSTSGEGSRLIWYPRRAAFRAGYVDGTQWDVGNIGLYSTAMGKCTKASGTGSTAMGYGTTASGIASTAMGYNTTAGDNSTAMGGYTTASSLYSTAMGGYTTASRNYSTAMGYYTTASGNVSTAMGYYTTAGSIASCAIGKYNIGGGTVGSWVSTDPLFEIGMGSDDTNRANAVTVLKNGNVGIGDETPDYLLDMESDASGGGYYSSSDHQWHDGSSRKLKQDIAPNDLDVKDILSDVQIVKYRFKTEVTENPNAPYHVGFIAEDTPEMFTGKDRNSMATGDCIGLLLAVVKEQQKTVEDQQKRIEGLESEIRTMKK